MRISIAQFNPTVGDFEYNLYKIQKLWKELDNNSDIIVFPELSVCGYNPQDLALRTGFSDRCQLSVDKLVDFSTNLESSAVVGSIYKDNNTIFNTAFTIYKGKIINIHNKMALPNYSIFDDKRLYTKGDGLKTFVYNGKKMLVLICEDIWEDYIVDKAKIEKPEIILCLNASPYTKDKKNKRYELLKSRTKELDSYIVYSNQVGLQDSVIYDGSSIIFDNIGNCIALAKSFEEDSISIEINSSYPPIEHEENTFTDIYNALQLALKDYLRKNNLSKVIIGFSAGIDSSLTTLLALDAIGKENVQIVTLPSKYTSDETYKDAKAFCDRNQILTTNISIDNCFELLSKEIEAKDSITNQNLQSRIRGTILMALSNKNSSLLLTTGNKSELACGYATLYGDMNGGYNLLKDLYKTEVYKLARWRNKNIPLNSLHPILDPLPSNIIKKAPTAELRENQKDSDSLPEYDILDNILMNYINKTKSRVDIINLGYKAEIVDQVLNLVRIAQFKRYQSTLGPKISNMSFDLEWRYPITNKFY